MGDSPSGCRRDDSGTFWTWGARPGSICRSETHRHDSVLGQVLWPPRELAAECDLFARNCKKTTVPETLNSPWWGCDTHDFADCDVRRYGRLLANPISQDITRYYKYFIIHIQIYSIFMVSFIINHDVYCQHVTTSPMSTVLRSCASAMRWPSSRQSKRCCFTGIHWEFMEHWVNMWNIVEYW